MQILLTKASFSPQLCTTTRSSFGTKQVTKTIYIESVTQDNNRFCCGRYIRFTTGSRSGSPFWRIQIIETRTLTVDGQTFPRNCGNCNIVYEVTREVREIPGLRKSNHYKQTTNIKTTNKQPYQRNEKKQQNKQYKQTKYNKQIGRIIN